MGLRPTEVNLQEVFRPHLYLEQVGTLTHPACSALPSHETADCWGKGPSLNPSCCQL